MAMQSKKWAPRKVGKGKVKKLKTAWTLSDVARLGRNKNRRESYTLQDNK